MDATYYQILIEVHLRNGVFFKGQVLTVEEMGPCAFILLHYGLAIETTAFMKAAA